MSWRAKKLSQKRELPRKRKQVLGNLPLLSMYHPGPTVATSDIKSATEARARNVRHYLT